MSLIYAQRNGRPIVGVQVAALVESMRVIGLKTPITVRRSVQIRNGRDIDAYDIVAGHHRYEAARKLAWTEIDAVVTEGDTELDDLWEIDENLIRAELTDGQRADHHTRREAILVRRGEVRSNGRPNSANLAKLSYADQAAGTLGVGRRTVARDLARGKKIDPDVLADVTGTALDTGKVLDELAGTAKDDQRAKLAEIQERRSIVRPAPDPLNDPEAHEKQLSALMAAWNRSAAVVREEFLLRVGVA